ncbi:MAG: DUF2281 domain-containing protein [Promethearchaeota archaeon]|nr:MAG: DUF2281 domain-containing protein [Candidatus Lokiarchaeota archaeon]
MSKKDIIIDELKQIPEKFLDEILDYIKFLKEKLIKQKMETAIMSESSLKKDWLRPEEDEAWLDL